MEKWEYRRYRIEVKGGTFVRMKADENYMEDVNALGRDGWELTAVVQLNETWGRTQAIEFIFKRRL